MKSEKQLYQWDVNQYFTELQPTAEFVDYPMGNEVIYESKRTAPGAESRTKCCRPTAEKPAMNVTRTEPSGRIVSRYSMRRNRRTMYSPQRSAPHSKP